MPFFKLFSKPRHQDEATDLYIALVNQARDPWFYDRLGVADTMDGRFDVIALHAFLVMQRLKTQGQSDLSQVLYDLMFADFEVNLRELGVSDMGVGPKVKKMIKALNGRLQAYDTAAEDTALEDALHRNVYRGDEAPDGAVAILRAYVRRQQETLAGQDLSGGKIAFAPVPEPAQ